MFSGVSFFLQVSRMKVSDVEHHQMSTRKRTEGLAKLHSHFKMESISQQGSISGQGFVSHFHFEPYSTVLTLCSENSIQASNENGGLRYLNKHENYL